jgi:hypothetical protein
VKAVGCVVVVVVVAVAGFIGLAAFLVTRGDDQSALTQRVALTVSDPQESRDPTQGRVYRFDYAYEHEGRWYAGEDRIRDNYWTPGQKLTACIDPDHPREHVVTIRMERCGQEIIVAGDVETASPTTAPTPGR